MAGSDRSREPECRPAERRREPPRGGRPSSDDTTQADAGMPGGTGAVSGQAGGRPYGTGRPGEPAGGPDPEAVDADDPDAPREEDPLADIAAEAERRHGQGPARDRKPPRGSEGSAGKIESGEW